MRVVDLQTMWKEEFFACEISSIFQRPSYRFLDGTGRRCNGFLYMEEGECVYWTNQETIRLHPGSLIYLPLHSVHKMKVTTETIAFTRTDFTVYDRNGEMTLFSKGPMLAADSAPQECADAIHELTQVCLLGENMIKSMALLYQALASLVHPDETVRYGKIAPAVRYIQEHFCETLDIPRLAGDCFLSVAQFYRLFQKNMGQTPLEYRNALRMKRACLLLREDDYPVGEIAALLGFENIYYFSRTFRNLVGISPSAYRKVQSERVNGR